MNETDTERKSFKKRKAREKERRKSKGKREGKVKEREEREREKSQRQRQQQRQQQITQHAVQVLSCIRTRHRYCNCLSVCLPASSLSLAPVSYYISFLSLSFINLFFISNPIMLCYSFYLFIYLFTFLFIFIILV